MTGKRGSGTQIAEPATVSRLEAQRHADEIRGELRAESVAGIRASLLLAVAHDSGHPKALGYEWFQDYALGEFGISDSAAYRRLAMANVAIELAHVAGIQPEDVFGFSERTAQWLKSRLGAVCELVVARTNGKPVTKRPELVAGAVGEIVKARAPSPPRKRAETRPAPKAAEVAASDGPDDPTVADTGAPPGENEDVTESRARDFDPGIPPAGPDAPGEDSSLNSAACDLRSGLERLYAWSVDRDEAEEALAEAFRDHENPLGMLTWAADRVAGAAELVAESIVPRDMAAVVISDPADSWPVELGQQLRPQILDLCAKGQRSAWHLAVRLMAELDTDSPIGELESRRRYFEISADYPSRPGYAVRGQILLEEIAVAMKELTGSGSLRRKGDRVWLPRAPRAAPRKSGAQDSDVPLRLADTDDIWGDE